MHHLKVCLTDALPSHLDCCRCRLLTSFGPLPAALDFTAAAADKLLLISSQPFLIIAVHVILNSGTLLISCRWHIADIAMKLPGFQ